MPRFAEFSLVFVAALVLLLPMILVAMVVCIAVGRPVVFSQVRSGRGGMPFVLRKFRSMTDARDDRNQLLPDVQRTTPITAILRRTRLDELPQLWSILVGEMALVGPRPLLPATIAEFGSLGVNRGVVRPGLTGWAQVSGNTMLSDHDKLALDLWYVAHRSIRLDLRILAETLNVALSGERIDPQRLAQAHSWMGERGLPDWSGAVVPA